MDQFISEGQMKAELYDSLRQDDVERFRILVNNIQKGNYNLLLSHIMTKMDFVLYFPEISN